MPNSLIFPDKDGEFNGYANIVVPYLKVPANTARLRVSTENIAAAEVAVAAWNDWYPKSTDANTRTKSITDHKKAARVEVTNILRTIYDDIPQSALTIEDRNTLRLAARKAPSDHPVPTTAPEGRVDTSERLQHTIYFHDAATPTRRAKPDGVAGCEIYYALTADAALDALIFIALDTASPYRKDWDTTFIGKNIYYWMRWVNTRGEHGPWGEVVMATATG